MGKARVGFIGCGGIAEAHLKGIVKNPDVEVVGLCDINLARAKQLAETYGVKERVFDKAEKMFNTVKLDAVYICLPPFAHGAELEAVKSGIPFFVEKPVNLYLKQARKIAAAVESKKLLTSVGYMNRYRAGVQKVRQLLKEDPAILVLGGWIGGTPRPSPGVTIWSWWVEKEKSGGQFHEQVTHTVDITRLFCGEVEQVHTFSAKGFNKNTPENYTIEDASVVNLKFTNGAIANLWASCSANGGGGGVSLDVYANNFTALFTGWEHSLTLMREKNVSDKIPGEPDIFAVEDNAFITAVRSDDPSKVQCPYADAVKTIEVTLAANKSIETGKPVKLPLASD